MRLEDFPVEVLMEIFVYFQANELYFSFSQLNNRLNLILKSLPNLVVIIKKGDDLNSPFLSFFNSVKKLLIKFDTSYGRWCGCKSHCINGGNYLYEIYPTLDNEWHSKYFLEVESLIYRNNYSQLRSLILPSTSPELTELIFRGEFPNLINCHLGKSESILVSLSSSIQLENIRQLTLRKQNGNEFERLLLVCFSLVYLDFSCLDILSPLMFISRCFPSMKYLRLGRLKNFFFHDGRFNFLLSLFPNLEQFSLTVDQCRGNVETVKFQEIANYFRHQCPLLKILILCIYMQGHMRRISSIGSFRDLTEMHPLFNYIDKCDSRLIISSHGFIQHQVYSYRYHRH